MKGERSAEKREVEEEKVNEGERSAEQREERGRGEWLTRNGKEGGVEGETEERSLEVQDFGAFAMRRRKRSREEREEAK